MFKKPKRNFRSRQHNSGSDDETKDEDPSHNDSSLRHAASAAKAHIGNASEKKGEIKKVSSANSILSFISEEEAEEEVFQVKKPNHSKWVVKQMKKGSDKEKDVSPVVKFDIATDSTPVKEKIKVEVIKKEEEEDSSSSEDDKAKSGVLMQSILKSGQIPDASLIHMARKRRQLARERGDDFIPIEGGADNGQGKKSSRLIRDDDDDKSDDSDDDQFAITSRQKDLERRKMEETILAAAEDSHSDLEQEWEEQQIRKGVSIPAQPMPMHGQDDYYANYQTFVCGNGVTLSSNYSAVNVTSGVSGYAANLVGISSGNLSYDEPKDLPTLTIDAVRKKLTDRLTEMVSTHQVHQHERDDLCSRTELSVESIEKHGSQAATLEEQYKFFQEMRGYVRDLVECLNEKMTSINYLERCMTKLYKENTEKLIKRRQEDVKQQSMEYMPGKVTTSGLEGNVSDDMKRRKADREGRRTRRKRKREASGIREHNDGLSTDDELNYSDNAKFTFTRDELFKSASTVFDDVADEFCQPELILNRFETWRDNYFDSYNEAYIGLCLPKLFTPFVKVELVYWNPLEENCQYFEDHRWFQSLIFYGWKDQSLEPPSKNDLKLVPNLVDKVIIPKLTVLVENLWDPLSSQQTRKLTALLRTLVDDYPTVHAENKNTQILANAIVQRIKKCLDDDIFMPLYPKQILENRTSTAALFFHRQFWTCIKLMQNIVQWHGIISDRQLMELSLDSLLNRYLVIAFQNSVFGPELINKLNAILEALPKEWFLPYTGDTTLPQLDNLCRCIVNVAVSSCPAQPVLSKDSRDLLRQLIKVLLNIHARKHAVSLANQVNLNVND